MLSQQSGEIQWGPIIMWGLLGAICAPDGQSLQTGVRFGAVGLLLQRPEIWLEWQRREALKEAMRNLYRQSNRRSLEEPGRQGQAVSPPTLRDGVYNEPDAKWREVIIPPSVVLVLGKRGSGKSALGYRLLELLRYAFKPYVVGLPKEGEKLLPDWIGMAEDIDEVPTKSVVLVDEAYLRYHSRESWTARSKQMSRTLNLSRQKEQTIIFVTQEARQIDRNIASAANVLIFKDTGLLQLQFDRPELNRVTAQARQALDTVNGDRHQWSFVYSPDAGFVGLLKNDLPSFWKPGLSKVFAHADPSTLGERAPRRMTPRDKAERAKQLRRQGASYGTIASFLGVTRSTVLNYLKGYPYRQRSA